MASSISSPPRSPPFSRSGASSPLPEHPRESLVSRLLITPLTFLSFIVSLFIVSSHNQSIRTSLHQHSPNPPQPTTLYGRIKGTLHAIVFKATSSPTTSPYAYISNPLEKHNIGIAGEGSDVKTVESKEGGGKGEKEWHYHTQQQKMMKAEMADAFRIRKWVLAVLVVGGGCVAAVMAVGVCFFIALGFRVWLREVQEDF